MNTLAANRTKIVENCRTALIAVAIAAAVLLAGCSAKDPTTTTPYYHVGTPTNQATVNSWEPNNTPYFTQPGVNRGDPAPLQAPIKSQRGFEPYDPVAEAVYNALIDSKMNVRYISVTAKKGYVVLTGSVNSPADATKAIDTARKVANVKDVKSNLTVATPQQAE